MIKYKCVCGGAVITCSQVITALLYSGIGDGNMKEDQKIDVICLFQKDGSLIPLKVKIKDENGEYQTYKVMGYKEVLEGELSSTFSMSVFDIKIEVYGVLKVIRICFSVNERTWSYRP